MIKGNIDVQMMTLKGKIKKLGVYKTIRSLSKLGYHKFH
ncbi:UNVERIFIED_ORG: hypothetical protein J2X74_005651 [Bacillus sp. 1751]|nr:hypothetical protein [Bacillus sp. 1751]